MRVGVRVSVRVRVGVRITGRMGVRVMVGVGMWVTDKVRFRVGVIKATTNRNNEANRGTLFRARESDCHTVNGTQRERSYFSK